MKNTKIKRLAMLMALICLQIPVWGQAPAKKIDLKILYVGGSAELEDFRFKDTVTFNKSVRERTAAFEKMLNDHFTSVTSIHADNYTQDLSEKYDVTVMDGTPKPISKGMSEQNAEGRTIREMPSGYYTEDFDRPVLTIGGLGHVLGRSIGSKINWLCQCLDADAHTIVREHPIFNGPFPVTMTIVEKPTPEEAIYSYSSCGVPPATLNTWAVQTKGYRTDRDVRTGVVSVGFGFDDSPDAEFISGGVSQKSLNSLAIGRHGNFLHWGFATSPNDMTEEAKTVLANAIVYISQFAGRGIIARQYDWRLPTRYYLDELKYFLSEPSYNALRDMQIDLNTGWSEAKKEALAKQERGEELDSRDHTALSYEPRHVPTYEDHVRNYQPEELFALFGTDAERYIKHYDDNRGYFYATGGRSLEVDEDVKSLGIPNNDKRILDEAIKLLEQGKDTEKAMRILTRYTLYDFETARQWRNWFETYKDKLFFTESGGWVFLVDSYEPEGVNDYNTRRKHEKVFARAGETDDKNPVHIVTSVVNKENGNREVIVKFKIHPGYHIYANVSDSDPYLATSVEIEVPEGCTAVGDIKKPPFKLYNQNGTTIYEGEAVFSREIMGKGVRLYDCKVSYQCCDANVCLPPVEKTFTVRTPLE